jgi:asparagine synthase (glutamine-hydrolysing)
MIPTYLVAQLVRQQCTVAVGGDGGDELFGGYMHYSRALWLEQKGRAVPLPIRRALSAAAEALLPVGLRGRKWLRNLALDSKRDVPLPISACYDLISRRRLTRPGLVPLDAERQREQRLPTAPDLLQRMLRQDFMNYLPEDILVKIDRASMLNSLEVRSPLLDYRIIDFAFRKVPSQEKTTSTTRKVLLKKLAARLLPAGFDMKRKHGFTIPLEAWISSGPWRTLFREVLLSSRNEMFDHKMISRMLSRSPKLFLNGERLFALVLLELWRAEYKISI